MCHCSRLWSAKYVVFVKHPALLALVFATALPLQHVLAQDNGTAGICVVADPPVFSPSSVADDEILGRRGRGS